MIINHKGFTVTGLVGDIAVQVNQDGDDTEVVVSGMGGRRSFDLDGLAALISDLEAVQNLANQVEGTNARAREVVQ